MSRRLDASHLVRITGVRMPKRLFPETIGISALGNRKVSISPSHNLVKISISWLIAIFSTRIRNRYTLYPLACNVFSSLRNFPIDTLKVVILGQDPYHGPNQAHGLCFSIQKGVQIPPSLRNIIKEAIEDVQITKPAHGCLISWCQQGVLLLNAVMTVRKGEANSHCKRGWERWTDTIIRLISDKTKNTVFLLWGRQAQVCRCMKCALHQVWLLIPLGKVLYYWYETALCDQNLSSVSTWCGQNQCSFPRIPLLFQSQFVLDQAQ